MLSTAERSPELLPTPEVQVWRAVLKLAVLDARKSNECHRRRNALAWLQSDQTGIGSAAWICAHLGIDHRALRKIRCAQFVRNGKRGGK